MKMNAKDKTNTCIVVRVMGDGVSKRIFLSFLASLPSFDF